MSNNDSKKFIDTDRVGLQKNSEPTSAALSPTQFIQQQISNNKKKEEKK